MQFLHSLHMIIHVVYDYMSSAIGSISLSHIIFNNNVLFTNTFVISQNNYWLSECTLHPSQRMTYCMYESIFVMRCIVRSKLCITMHHILHVQNLIHHALHWANMNVYRTASHTAGTIHHTWCAALCNLHSVSHRILSCMHKAPFLTRCIVHQHTEQTMRET